MAAFVRRRSISREGALVVFCILNETFGDC
ncbi:MAG: hypothetical protein AW11_00626 [Candidatus Accumulibacter regalis]|jgi:hypothetical protein|uniref:Uncharacterized protein n=1 Tax=Accumulibacter regalis TaxID=522306 RepID=A0A011P719_ACCRE|nr:MAG: hypothetical protein AW11_00626 [Candidatus Accumulibacter regalis]